MMLREERGEGRERNEEGEPTGTSSDGAITSLAPTVNAAAAAAACGAEERKGVKNNESRVLGMSLSWVLVLISRC